MSFIFEFISRFKDPKWQRWAMLLALALVNVVVNFIFGRASKDEEPLLKLVTYSFLLLLTFVVSGLSTLRKALSQHIRDRPLSDFLADIIPYFWIGIKVIVLVLWALLGEDEIKIDPIYQAIDGFAAILVFTSARPQVNVKDDVVRQKLIDGSVKILQARAKDLINAETLDNEGDLNKFILVPRAFRPDLVNLPDREDDSLPPESNLQKMPFSKLITEGSHGWLITGPAGSGKSSALISIMSDVLTPFAQLHGKYVDDNKSDIPVKVELSDWPRSGKSFGVWLLDEIAETYKISAISAKKVTDGDGTTNSFILLLDGLDEMSGTDMRTCIRGINELLKQPDDKTSVRPRVVVCCRDIEYREAIEAEDIDPEASQTRIKMRKLQLDGAVELLELETPQIKTYLAAALSTKEQQIEAENISINEKYLTIFRSPLILALAIKAEMTLETLQSTQESSTEALERDIYRKFVEHALTEYAKREKPDDVDRFKQRVKERLAWLANKMPKNIFTIEDLQPVWLRPKPESKFLNLTFLFWLIVYLLVSRILVSVIVAFGAGLSTASPFENIAAGAIAGLFISAFDLLRFYARRNERPVAPGEDAQSQNEVSLSDIPPLLKGILNFINKLRETQDKAPLVYDPSYWKAQSIRLRRGAIGFIVVFLGCGLVISLHFAAINAHYVEPGTGVFGSTISATGVVRALFMSLFLAFFLGIGRTHHSLHTDITMIEHVETRWDDAIITGVQWAIIAGLIVGIIAAGLYDGSDRDTIRQWLNYSTKNLFNLETSPTGYFLVGALFGVAGGFVTGLLGGILRLQQQGARETFDPNRGIAYSLGNATRNLVVLGGLFALLMGGAMLLMTGDVRAAGRVALSGLSVGVFASPQYGALAIINHITLKLIFFIRDLPFRYLGHLEGFSGSRLIVRKGRGYAFYHDHVLEHFRAEKPFEERLKPRRLLGTLGVIGLGCALFISLPDLHARLMRIDVPETAFYLTGPIVTTDQEFETGEKITIHSKGMFRTGAYVGYVPPEGTETGIFGAPIGDTYDVGVSEDKSGEGDGTQVPHGGLLCRVEGDVKWQGCAILETWGTPYSWRVYQFEMLRKGKLQFRVNDYLLNDTAGSFAVYTEPPSTVNSTGIP